MKNRYLFLKKIYKNYLIYFWIHNKKKLYDKTEKEMYNYIMENKNYKINYIIVDNLDIIEKKVYENNNYEEVICKIKLNNFIEIYKRRVIKWL